RRRGWKQGRRSRQARRHRAGARLRVPKRHARVRNRKGMTVRVRVPARRGMGTGGGGYFGAMRKIPVLVLSLLSGLVATAAAPKNEPCPTAVSNNAVAGLKVGSHHLVYSFMGIGAKKTWDDILNVAYELDLGTGKWTELRPVPGAAGRIAAGAA